MPAKSASPRPDHVHVDVSQASRELRARFDRRGMEAVLPERVKLLGAGLRLNMLHNLIKMLRSDPKER